MMTADDKILHLDDSFESFKRYNYKPKYTLMIIIGYVGWLVFGSVTAFNLYLDYKCTNFVVPKNYIHYHYSRSLLSEDVRSFTNESNGLLVNSLSVAGPLSNSVLKCTDDAECNHGICAISKDIYGNVTGSKCNCDKEYITVNPDICNYHQLSGVVAIILSVVLGLFGIDRCFIARGNGCGICLGILKGITGGGFGIWWIYDIVVIALGNLPDGNNQPLTSIG